MMKRAKSNNRMKNRKMIKWKFVTQFNTSVSKENQKKKGKQKDQNYKI
jgi:hypothetical protein